MNLKSTLTLTLTGLVLATCAMAQDLKYRRSSLHTVLIETGDFPYKAAVMKAWENYPFPDKYNNHTVGSKVFYPSLYKFSEQDRVDAGLSRKPADHSLAQSYIPVEIYWGDDEIPAKIERYIRETQMAKQLVAKWFNRSVDGRFNMGLIQERGFYNASEMEAEVAKGQARGLASLGDAGEELIANTFVTFSKLRFVENEPTARKIRDAALKAAEVIPIPIVQQAAIQSANLAYETTKDGYTVWTQIWMYKLKWNDSIANIFYSNLWTDKAAFDRSNLFSLELVGQEQSSSSLVFAMKQFQSQEEIIRLATVRNIDNTYAKLQKKYDVFKPKVPVYSNDPITAQIGRKEGLNGGEKFDVLEMVLNPKTNRTEYKIVGKVTVDKKAVWDNRYAVGETPKPGIVRVERTAFKGSKKVQVGMLLRQSK